MDALFKYHHGPSQGQKFDSILLRVRNRLSVGRKTVDVSLGLEANGRNSCSKT